MSNYVQTGDALTIVGRSRRGYADVGFFDEFWQSIKGAGKTAYEIIAHHEREKGRAEGAAPSDESALLAAQMAADEQKKKTMLTVAALGGGAVLLLLLARKK